MKKLLFALLACCLLLCGCEKEKPNNDPLLSVRWETEMCRGVPADVISMRCSEEKAAEVEKKLEEALTDFPCRTREEVTACAWALCDILIENDCLDASWVPVRAMHYTDGIWLVGFASVRDREMLRDYESQHFDLTMFELLSYDGMRCLTFTPAQPEVYLATDTLPEQPYTIDWLDVAPETLTFQKDGQKVTLPLKDAPAFDDEKLQRKTLAASPAFPIEDNAGVCAYASAVGKALQQCGYLAFGELECWADCYANGIIWLHYSCGNNTSAGVIASATDGQIIHVIGDAQTASG